MGLAYPMQKFQDWFTQQWVILSGRKIDPVDFAWLMGPFGELDGIGEDVIHQLAEKENLIIRRDGSAQGLIPSISMLNLPVNEQMKLSKRVSHFYEHTSGYNLEVNVKWNPFFRFLGALVNGLFSSRINQLNIPVENENEADVIKSEIITLAEKDSGETRYTIWLRTSVKNHRVMYSGIYGTCKLPSGQTCIKAVFPLPKGNATVVMNPRVGDSGELILESAGKKIGDTGFYFLVRDAQGNHWAHLISSFRDRLTIMAPNEGLVAEQVLTLWGLTVVKMNYKIERKGKIAE